MILLDAVTTITAAPGVPVTVSAGPVWTYLQPFLLSAFGVVFSVLLGWGISLLQKHTSIVVSQQARDTLQTAAMNAAGRIMASQDSRFAQMKFETNNPLISAEIPIVENAVKDAVTQLGITPDMIGKMIAGKIGQLQAQAQSVTPPEAKTGAA